MKAVTKYMNQAIDGRQVEEFRTGNQKITITYPVGTDVRVEHVGDVRKIGERPVLPEDEGENPFSWDYPIAASLLGPKQDDEIG